MRSARLALLPFLLPLGACHGPAADAPPTRLAGGRYIGIGVYPTGPLWQHLAIRRPAAGVPSASIADDEHIIVVVDSRSGEVRECGDYSAVCIALTPWERPLAMPRGAPAVVDEHAADLERQGRKGG